MVLTGVCHFNAIPISSLVVMLVVMLVVILLAVVVLELKARR